VPSSPRVSHRIDAGAVALACYDWGGDGSPVLLAHPTGFHGRAWAPVAARLVHAGRHVFSFDFRGHGDSDRSPTGYHWDGFADDVLAVIDDLGLAHEPTLLAAGHSKGAAALLLAEARVPDTFARLWCYEPIMVPGAEPLEPSLDNPLSVGALKRRFVWDSPDEAFAAFSARPPLNALTPDALHAYIDDGLRARADGRYELKCLPEDEAAVFSMGLAHDAYQRLDEVHCPTVIACGEHSNAIGPAIAEQLAAQLPDGRLEVMPGLGHFGPLEDPDAIVASMLRFAAATA
jgi:pimeloyl-ACP methyl ester carboxylesterase